MQWWNNNSWWTTICQKELMNHLFSYSIILYLYVTLFIITQLFRVYNYTVIYNHVTANRVKLPVSFHYWYWCIFDHNLYKLICYACEPCGSHYNFDLFIIHIFFLSLLKISNIKQCLGFPKLLSTIKLRMSIVQQK